MNEVVCNMRLKRIAKRDTYTIGRLYIDGTYFCDTLEDKVRNLAREKKVYAETAIPEGTYDVVVNISPKFKRLLPQILNVPHFEGIRIHRGNTAKDTAGCPLVGENKYVGMVTNSTYWEERLTGLLLGYQERNIPIKITIE